MEIVSPMCHASSAVTQLYAHTPNTYKSAPRLLTSCCTGPAQLAGERCQTWLCIMPISSSPGRAVSEVHHVQGTSLNLMTTRTHFPPAFSVHPLGIWLEAGCTITSQNPVQQRTSVTCFLGPWSTSLKVPWGA